MPGPHPSVDTLGIVIETRDPERAWNAFRLGITALENDHDVSVFLLGEGVEVEHVTEEPFDVRNRMTAFTDTLLNGHARAPAIFQLMAVEERVTHSAIRTDGSVSSRDTGLRQ